ncbi:hypothetical protein D3C72_1389960 [compost metagenome]
MHHCVGIRTGVGGDLPHRRGQCRVDDVAAGGLLGVRCLPGFEGSAGAQQRHAAGQPGQAPLQRLTLIVRAHLVQAQAQGGNALGHARAFVTGADQGSGVLVDLHAAGFAKVFQRDVLERDAGLR